MQKNVIFTDTSNMQSKQMSLSSKTQYKFLLRFLKNKINYFRCYKKRKEAEK